MPSRCTFSPIKFWPKRFAVRFCLFVALRVQLRALPGQDRMWAAGEQEPEADSDARESPTAPTCPGDEVCAFVNEAWDKGHAYEVCVACAADSEFLTWLSKETMLAPDEGDWNRVPDSEQKEKGYIPLARCPLGFGRQGAMRAVTRQSLKEKMEAFAIAQTFRNCDTLVVSRLAGTAGTEGVFIEDFHIRLCALVALFTIYWKLRLPVPASLKRMGQRVPVEYRGHATRKEALSRAVANSAALQCGVTHLSWVDVMCHVIEGSQTDEGFADDLQTMVLTISPEFGRKLVHWQHVESILKRVNPECFHDAERIFCENCIPLAILPITWYREPYFLQPSRVRQRATSSSGEATGLSPIEQVCANRRMLSAAVDAWKDHDRTLTSNALCRSVSTADLKKFAASAKKFASGMLAQEQETNVTWRDCLDKFASGACDGHLETVREPYLAQYWPWVVELKRERRGTEVASELQAAEEREAKIRQEKEALENQMEERDQETAPELESKHGEIAAKEFEAASDTFRASLHLHFSELQKFGMDRMPEAVKIWEAKAARSAALEATWGEKKGGLEAFFLFSDRPHSIFFDFRYAGGGQGGRGERVEENLSEHTKKRATERSKSLAFRTPHPPISK